MKNMKRTVLVLISAACMCFASTGCSEKKAPEPKDTIEKAAEETEEAVEEVADETKEAVEETGDAVEEATD